MVPRRDIDFIQLIYFGFQDLFAKMGWLLIVFLSESDFPNLVGAFCAKARYHVGGPISYTLRGAEIELDANAICRIIGVPTVRLRIYES